MTIAEKILRAKDDYDTVYEAGYEKGKAEGGGGGVTPDNILYYATTFTNTYEGAVFPENYNMVLRIKEIPVRGNPAGFYRTFVGAKNLKSVKISTDDKESLVFFPQTFRECSSVEVVDLTECSRNFSGLEYCCFQASNLVSIFGALDISECKTNSSLNYAFFAGKLKDVEFVPNTIVASIRFSSAYLTEASIESIINGLADLTGGTAQTITLNGVGASLTADQKARIAAKNWTLTY